MTDDDAIPEKSCGDCIVCCYELAIKQMDKKARVLCEHCTGKGCGIYETRPDVCRDYLCGWRVLRGLDEYWRPDRSGVLIRIVDKENVPEEYREVGAGLCFHIVEGEAAIRRPRFIDYIFYLIKRRVAVYMSMHTPSTIVNQYLTDLVAANDRDGVTRMLVHIFNLHLQVRDPSIAAMPPPVMQPSHQP